MSEHQLPDHDPQLSALYRRSAGEEPSAPLDARIVAQARHQAVRRRQRRWLPLATAAVVVLAMGLLLRHQQRPDELRPQLALELPQEAQSKAAAPVVALPAAPLRRDEAAVRREVAGAESRAKAEVAVAAKEQMMEGAVEREAPAAAPSPAPASSARVASEPSPAAPLGGAAEAKRAGSASPAPAARMERSLADEAPSAAAGVMAESVPPREAGLEPPAAWLKRIEALRAKGELEAARRELAAFRKAYPQWRVPEELQPLLPQAVK